MFVLRPSDQTGCLAVVLSSTFFVASLIGPSSCHPRYNEQVNYWIHARHDAVAYDAAGPGEFVSGFCAGMYAMLTARSFPFPLAFPGGPCS